MIGNRIDREVEKEGKETRMKEVGEREGGKRCTQMYIRAKSYGVHMETSWRCVTNWARETNKLCRIYPSTGGRPICRYRRPCIVCAYRSICIVTRDAFRNCIPRGLDTSVIVSSTGTVYRNREVEIGMINIIVCSCFERIIDLVIISFARVHGEIL